MKFLKSPCFAMLIMGLIFIIASPFIIIQPFKEGQGNIALIVVAITFLLIGTIITVVSIIKYKNRAKYANKRYLPEEKIEIYKEQMMKEETENQKLTNYSNLMFCISFFAVALICLFIAINDNMLAIIGTIVCLIIAICIIVGWRKEK